MGAISGWVFVIGCAVGTPADQCMEQTANGYFYDDIQSCQLDNAGDPRHNAKCVEVVIVKDAGQDPAAGRVERLLDSLDDSAGRE